MRGEKRIMYSLWSLLLWFLFAMILTGLVYPVWWISQSGRRAILGSIPSVSQTSAYLRSKPRLAGRQKRQMKWISFDEFMTLLREQSSDLVVIDLRGDAPWVRFPVPTVLVLPVTPHDLIRVLEWLPADRSAVFYGASDSCIFTIETSACMKGSAPLYILDDSIDGMEAA